MLPFVRPLSSIRLADAGSTGGKAAVLGTLLEAGFPVPDGFCVTADAFRQAVAPFHDDLDATLCEHEVADPFGAQASAQAVDTILSKLTVPTDVAQAVRDALAVIAPDDAPVAVRSTATAEDLAGASFAGQYDSILGVTGGDAVLEAIVACWRSFYNARVLLARAVAGLLEADHAMAVLVQRMVNAECAGVCFTADPVHKTRDLIVMNAAWGLGTGVVDGAVAADTYTLPRDKPWNARERHIVEKTEQFVLDPHGTIQRVPVPDDHRKAACLPNPYLHRVYQFAIAVETLLGRAQDVEWAIADDRIWILQSRPITALPPEIALVPPFPVEWKSDSERRTAWFVEFNARTRVPLPLEHDVNDVWIMGDFDVAYMTGRKRRPERREFHGRGYVAWVSTGLREGERRIKERANRDLGIRLRDAGMTEWDYWGPEVVEATERLRTFDAEHADGPQQADHLEDAFGADRHHWMIHWLLNFWDGIGPYQKAVEAVTGLTGQAAEHIATRLAEGEESWHSRMIDGLYELALLARDVPALVALIAELPVNARDRLDALPEARTFLVRLDLYLDDFGDHTGSGAGSDPSILRPTWREDCALVLSLVAPYLDSRTPAPSEVRARRLRERDIELRNVCGRCSDPEKVAELRRWLPLARKRAGVLEAHNYYIDQMSLGQLRGAIMAAGTWLAEHGALQTAGDVFWLRRDEVGQALKAATPPSFATLIAERQRQREEWSQLQPPEIMGVPDPVLDPRPPLKDEVEEQQPVGNHLLKGQAASAGRYRGRARVVTETRGIPVVAAGDVLVAEQAGPMWTPLFPVLGALVLDNAALTQHAATTAREYRIPTVINTRSAILRIPDGAWVTVDGDDGTVEVEES